MRPSHIRKLRQRLRAGLRSPESSVSPMRADMKPTCLRPRGDLLPHAPPGGAQEHPPVSAWDSGESGRDGMGWDGVWVSPGKMGVTLLTPVLLTGTMHHL